MTGPMVFGLIIAVLLIGFPLFWLGAVFWTSRMGGWHSLVPHYSALSQPSHPVKRGVHLYMKPSRFRAASYQKSIRVGVDREAIYLSTVGPWKPFHKPLRLPFEDMTVTEKGQTLIRHLRPSVWKSVEVTFKLKPSVELSFREKYFDWIMETRQELMGKNT